MKKTLFLVLIINILLSTISFSFCGVSAEKPTKEEKRKNRVPWLHRDTVFMNQKITTSEYTETKNDWGVTIGGFICTDLFWDSREMVGARDGGILLYPAAPRWDADDKDINATPSFNFLAMNSRLSVRISAPSVLKAQVGGFIEGWFMGASNDGMNNFALRHSYIRLSWSKNALLVGQTWHPMFTENCFAATLAASTGAPFQPFSRAPQVRFTQQLGKPLRLMLYANTQLDQPSVGLNGSSSEYLRRSAIPEAGFQFQYSKDHENAERNSSTHFLIGIGADYKRLIPRLVTADNHKTKKGVNCGAALLFAHFKYTKNGEKRTSFGVKAKGFYGGGYNEMLMLGGYTVKKYNEGMLNFNNDFDYTTINMFSGWLDLYAEHGKWEFGIFNGYCKNLGAYSEIQEPGVCWGRGIGIDHLYRASIRTKFNAGKLQIGVEPEYTLAYYGRELDNYGKVAKSDETDNIVHGLRLLLSMTLFF